jgi:hypothetical protein
MIDAYEIGITLALDNGVSEGLATIRRDLIALNAVVDSSATRLKHLTRAAGDLRIGRTIPEAGQNGPAVPSHKTAIGSTLMSIDSAGLDAGAFGLDSLDLHTTAKTLVPMFVASTAEPTADPEGGPPIRPDMTAPRDDVLVLNVPTPISAINAQSDGAAVPTITSDAHPFEILSRSAAQATPPNRTGDYQVRGFGTAPAHSAIIGEVSPRSLPLVPKVSPTLDGECPTSYPPQAWAAGSQTGPFGGSREARPDAAAWADPRGADATSSSAIPPTTQPQSAPLQGEIYLDGSRLGRWMTDRLARAAELPRAAMTGFDPRMTPTWPGAPVSA